MLSSRLVRAAVITVVLIIFGSQLISHHTVRAQESSPPNTNEPTVRAQARLVLVDTVVTDKHGNYIHDLSAKDFRVWEDNKEQTVKSFSYESTSPNSGDQKHYLVIFFDNSTMNLSDQPRARDAAAKFIDANSGPNRLIAVVDFGGALRVAQNFTADAARLKQVVAGVKPSAVSPNEPAPVEVASLGMPPLGNAEADFGAHSFLLALRSLAKNLATVPGRKSLVLLTAGFPLNAERQSEMVATIDACNKANVAVYPVDVRGLMAPVSAGPGAYGKTPIPSHTANVVPLALRYTGHRSPRPRLIYVQHAGGGAGGGGGRPGGGGGPVGGGGGGARSGGGGGGGKPGGSPAGSGSRGSGSTGGVASRSNAANYSNFYNPNYQPRQIVPHIPESTSTNQQLMYALADGTGGFVIVNTNDLAGGMDKIAKEQNEYYLLGYTPPDTPEGSCHSLRVKVDRGGTVVRSRSGYCNVKPVDVLAGKPTEKVLESRVTGTQAGNIPAAMQLPFFYTSPNTARVNLVLEIPARSLHFEKQKGKFHSSLNVLGIAYNTDGSTAARFSDTVDLDLDNKKEVEEFANNPFHYENQFELGAGQHQLKVVFSSNDNDFGKIEAPLVIDPYDGKQFSMSAVALSKEMHSLGDADVSLDATLLQDRTPLVSQGMQIVPTANYSFKKDQAAAMYLEVYEPLMRQDKPPQVGLEIRILDSKTGQQKMEAGFTNTQASMQSGNPVIPLGLKLPVERLDPGSYRLEVRAVDSAGNSSKTRTSEFQVQ